MDVANPLYNIIYIFTDVQVFLVLLQVARCIGRNVLRYQSGSQIYSIDYISGQFSLESQII